MRPRAGSRISDPHQPHARICPGRRGDRERRSSEVVAALVVLVSLASMDVPSPGCFVPTTLAGRECKRCVSYRFLRFLGGARVVRLSGSVAVGSGDAVVGRCDGSDGSGDLRDEIGQQAVRRKAQRVALDALSKPQPERCRLGKRVGYESDVVATHANLTAMTADSLSAP